MPIFPPLPGRVDSENQIVPPDLTGVGPVSIAEGPFGEPLPLPVFDQVGISAPQSLPRRSINEEPRFPLPVLPDGRIDESQLRLERIYVAPDGTAWRWQGRRFNGAGATRRSLSVSQMSKRALGLGPTAVRLGPDEMQNRADLSDAALPLFDETPSNLSQPTENGFPISSGNGLPLSLSASSFDGGRVPSSGISSSDEIAAQQPDGGAEGEALGEDTSRAKRDAPTKIVGKIGDVSFPNLEIIFKRAWPCGSMMPSVISTGPSALLNETMMCLFFNVAGSVKLTVICEERSNDSENRLVNRWENQITVHARIPNEIRYVVGTILPGPAGRVLSTAKALSRLPEAEQAIRKSLEIIELLQSEAVRLATQKGLDGVCKLST